ncbi:MAG: hypothetical protein TREMPRED_002645 [Tremellales sp. Tagirdzhanova-0007]|nr:MAG: hypothetical protein TREMPRED_002645 [Tremellales sp. Tagirdzhanova-0007]
MDWEAALLVSNETLEELQTGVTLLEMEKAQGNEADEPKKAARDRKGKVTNLESQSYNPIHRRDHVEELAECGARENESGTPSARKGKAKAFLPVPTAYFASTFFVQEATL